MRRSAIVIGAVVALGAAVAFAWYVPTVVAAAPLWVMALCVVTGYRSAPDPAARDAPVDRPVGRDALVVLSGGQAGSGDRGRAAS